MLHRSHLPQAERRRRSRLLLLLKDQPILRGTLLVLRNTCGKSNCRCARGEKHESLYAVQSRKGKRHARCIPKAMRKDVRQWVDRYKEIQELLEELSEECWRRLDERDETK